MACWISLPRDLVDSILSRVPAKTLARLRSTSKQWNALLKSKSLAMIHSTKAPKEPLIIMLIHSRVFLVRINLLPTPSVNFSALVYLKNPLLCNHSSQVDIHKVFHCDGLLLCTTKDNRLVVYNPCSGQTKWVQPPNRYYKESVYYALGYDHKNKSSYKILWVHCQDFPIKNNEYKIYDLTNSNNSWRAVGVSADWFLTQNHHGVSVKGNTYWIATRTSTQLPQMVLTFDFSTEMFQSVSLPDHGLRRKIWSLSMDVSHVTREEQLCLLGVKAEKFNESKFIQVWVMTDGSSWNESLALERTLLRMMSTFFKNTSFLVDNQNKNVVSCSPNNILDILNVRGDKRIIIDRSYFGGDSINGKSSSSLLFSYVPSLAQIQ